jgi:hypothetical protein
MFLTGTRVYVHNSTVPRDKTGPRKHSIGYVSVDNDLTCFNRAIEGYPVKDQAFTFTPVKIVFSRYGLEEKGRCETRIVLAVTPTQTVMYTGKPSTPIKNNIRMLMSNELAKNSGWRISDSVAKDTAVITSVPATNTDIDGVRAKLISIIKSTLFKEYVTGTGAFNPLANNGPNKLEKYFTDLYTESAMLDLIYDRANRNAAMKNPSAHLTRILNTVMTVINRAHLNHTQRYIDAITSHTGQQTTIQRELMFGMFEAPTILANKIKSINKIRKRRDIIGPLLDDVVSNISVVRNAYLNLKPKHI